MERNEKNKTRTVETENKESGTRTQKIPRIGKQNSDNDKSEGVDEKT